VESVLEIKCPISYRNKPIIENGKPNLKYIQIDENGKPELKKKYYVFHRMPNVNSLNWLKLIFTITKFLFIIILI